MQHARELQKRLFVGGICYAVAVGCYRAVIWLHGDAITVEYQAIPLAQYTVCYQPD